MKKIFTLLCVLLFALHFASAQQTLFVLSKSGDLSAYPAKKVTFDDMFTFAYGEVTEVTKQTFSASFSVAFKSIEYQHLQQSKEVGVCFSDINERPNISDGKIKMGTLTGKYDFHICALDPGTTYYYRAYVKVGDAVFYGDVQNETTLGKKPTNNYKIINGHKFVDLGLPSGLLWAETNIGAATTADDGDYFAWGETQTKSYYGWNTYKYGTSYNNQTKYNSTDAKTVLDKEDDAAYVNWGDSCRMPTKDEFAELLNPYNCTWIWTSKTTSSGSDICGYKITSVRNSNSIFLPALGCRIYDYIGDNGVTGRYWSASLMSASFSIGYSQSACDLRFNNMYYEQSDTDRSYGYTIRPVAEP